MSYRSQAYTTVADAARRLGVSRTRVYQLMDNWQLANVRIGHSRFPVLSAISARKALLEQMENDAVIRRSQPSLKLVDRSATRAKK